MPGLSVVALTRSIYPEAFKFIGVMQLDLPPAHALYGLSDSSAQANVDVIDLEVARSRLSAKVR